MKHEDQGQCSSQSINNFQTYQEQLFLQQQMMQQQQQNFVGGGRGFNMFPDEVSNNVLQPWSVPPVQPFNPVRDYVHDPFSPYANLLNRRINPSLQFAYEGPSCEQLRMISDTLVHHHHHHHPGSVSVPFGLQAELGKMSAQEIMEAKALAASKSHSEAERRRRERINNHLARLRSLLPSTTKTDKASLLAEVIQHVKELKRQTSLIEETSAVPTESDEVTVDAADEDGKFVIKASLCCEDRSDLLPELIKALKELKLRTFKAEITTLGGRVKNVLFITGEEDSSNGEEEHSHHHQQYCIGSIQETLKAVMEKSVGNENGSGSVKRQRTNTISIS